MLLVLLLAGRVLALDGEVSRDPSGVKVVERIDFDASTGFTVEPRGPTAGAARGATGLRLRFTGGAVDAVRRVCPEVTLSLPAPAGSCFQVEAVSSLEGHGGSRAGWLSYDRSGVDRIHVRLPLDARARTIDVRVVEGAPAPAGAEYAQVEDPLDPAPLGDRTPVFLAHGFDSGHSLLPFDPARNKDFDALRGLPEYRRSFQAFKYYYFSYRPWADYRAVGAGMAREIKRVLAHAPATPCVVVGRSGGAIPARYAAADPELAPRVLGIVTLCGAMRGSVGSSLLHANGRVAERIGVPGFLLLRLTQRAYPFSPMLDSLTFDNFDGTIDAQALSRYGLMENVALREFNSASSDARSLVAYMGEVTNLWGWGDYHVKDEIYRRVLASFDPSWGSADPLVHKSSGTLAGKPVRLVRLLPGRHHSEVLSDPVLMRTILLDLYQFHRARRFGAVWGVPLTLLSAP